MALDLFRLRYGLHDVGWFLPVDLLVDLNLDRSLCLRTKIPSRCLGKWAKEYHYGAGVIDR